MITTGYYDWAACPTTDEDAEIIRGLAHRLGATYWGIHQTAQGHAVQLDVMNTTQYARGKRPGGWRYDACGRLHTISWSHSGIACYR